MKRRWGAPFGVFAFVSVAVFGLVGLGPASAGGPGVTAYLYLSSTTSCTAGGVTFADEDVVQPPCSVRSSPHPSPTT